MIVRTEKQGEVKLETTAVIESPFLSGPIEMTNDEYHASEGISKSHLDYIASRRRSPLHYWQKYINPDREPEEKTYEMVRGSAIHSAILQPEVAEKMMVIGLAHARRSKAEKEAWAEFEAKHANQYILKPADFDEALRVRDRFWSHPVASGLVQDGIAEQSFFAVREVPDYDDEDGGLIIDHETGKPILAQVKCQTDFIRRKFDYIVDLKTTDDASPEGFARSCANYRYPVQAAWYQDTLRALYGQAPENWILIAMEKSAPYAIGVYFWNQLDVGPGRVAADRDFSRIIKCRRDGVWPDYAEAVQRLEMPKWTRL